MVSENNMKSAQDKTINFYAVSLIKLTALYISSFGICLVYWFYRNWKAVKEAENLQIEVFWYAIFSMFSCYWLFYKIFDSNHHKEIKNYFLPYLLSLLYMSIWLVIPAISLYMGTFLLFILIPIMTFLPIIFVQYHINNALSNRGCLKLEKKFSREEKNLVAIGLFFWGSILVALLIGLAMTGLFDLIKVMLRNYGDN